MRWIRNLPYALMVIRTIWRETKGWSWAKRRLAVEAVLDELRKRAHAAR